MLEAILKSHHQELLECGGLPPLLTNSQRRRKSNPTNKTAVILSAAKNLIHYHVPSTSRGITRAAAAPYERIRHSAHPRPGSRVARWSFRLHSIPSARSRRPFPSSPSPDAPNSP